MVLSKEQEVIKLALQAAIIYSLVRVRKITKFEAERAIEGLIKNTNNLEKSAVISSTS